jgi:hypothetical protein
VGCSQTTNDGKSYREVFSSRNNTHEVMLTLLYMNNWLLVMMILIFLGALPRWTGLVPPRVWAFIGEMPVLSTIVANAGRKSFRLGSLLTWLLAAVVTLFAPTRTKFP